MWYRGYVDVTGEVFDSTCFRWVCENVLQTLRDYVGPVDYEGKKYVYGHAMMYGIDGDFDIDNVSNDCEKTLIGSVTVSSLSIAWHYMYNDKWHNCQTFRGIIREV